VKNKIIQGDCRQLIKNLTTNTVDLTITSPPYFLQREYGDKEEIGQEGDLDEYLDVLLEVFRECLRVTKEDGSIIWNMGDKYLNSSLQLAPYRFAAKVVDETDAILINNISWSKSNPVPRQFNRRMVSSHEPFFHFVKSNKYKYYGDRLTKVKENKPNPDTKVGRKYFKIIENSDLSEEEKCNAINELGAVIDEVKSGKISGFRMKVRGIHALAFGGQEGGRNNQIKNNGFSVIRLSGKTMLKDIIECPVESIKGTKHPAIYPLEIVEKLILLTTDEGDLVLDPFMGSGTTALACIGLKRLYTGFELYEDYIKQIEERLWQQKI